MKRVWMAAVLAAAMATTARAQEEYVLQYKHPKVGEPVVQHVSGHVVGTFTGLGVGTMKMTQKVGQWIRLECLEVNEDGSAKLRMSFQRFAMDMDVGPTHVSFDSAEPPSSQPDKEDPAKKALRQVAGAMVSGKGLTAVVTAEGKCLKIEGVDEMFSGIKDIPGGEQMGKALKEGMLENAASDDWCGQGVALPKRPVRIGEVWSGERRMNMGPMGKMLAKSKNKLLGVETVNGRHIARIAQTINMEMTPDLGSVARMPGMENVQMRMVSQGGTGTLLWDIDKARLIKMQQTAPLEMNVDFGSTTQPSASVRMSAKFHYSQVARLEGDDLADKLLPTDEPKAAPVAPAAGETAAPAGSPAQGQ